MQPVRAKKVNLFTLQWYPLSQSYGVILPSSLTKVHSIALVFSTSLPVSVLVREPDILPRGFSWQLRINHFTAIGSASHLGLNANRIYLASALHACTQISKPRWSTFLRHPIGKNATWLYRNINLLSIAYASQPQLRPRLTLGGLAFPRKP